MTDQEVAAIEASAAAGTAIGGELALAVLKAGSAELPRVFAAAAGLKQRRFGNTAHLCSIMNARCGACPEDCAFCAQAACHATGVDTYGLAGASAIHAEFAEAEKLPVSHFGVVTSGGALNDAEVERVAEAFRSKKSAGLHWCGSLGCLSEAQLARLKAAGMKRFHHNLETAESYFPTICTTHTYADRLATLRAAKRAGLELCCGGILGLGETLEQRVEFAQIVAREPVDSIPLNFLVAIPGTRLEGAPPMRPLEILRAVAMFRLVNPAAEIKVCAGRLLLRDMQSMIFLAGASGMMVGRLLTVAGRDVETDLQMLRDLELTTERCC